MPLIKSGSNAAFKTNVGNLMKEVGSSPHVQSRDQALAIAYDIKRKNKAGGGKITRNTFPWQNLPATDPYEKPRSPRLPIPEWHIEKEGKEPQIFNRRPNFSSGGAPGVHVGPIMSAVPGRTDNHPMDVKAGSYVFPADHVSNLGQNNTIAGLDKLQKMFKMGPYGVAVPKIKRGKGLGIPKPPRLRAEGGAASDDGIGEPTPINAAGGEFVVPPEKILEWMEDNGFSPDLDAGHKELDQWVLSERKQHLKTLSRLPGPAK